jgi:hypothetical protein
VAKSDRRLVDAASLDPTDRSRKDTARFWSLTPYGERVIEFGASGLAQLD